MLSALILTVDKVNSILFNLSMNYGIWFAVFYLRNKKNDKTLLFFVNFV